jgi:hypothetical protein
MRWSFRLQPRCLGDKGGLKIRIIADTGDVRAGDSSKTCRLTGGCGRCRNGRAGRLAHTRRLFRARRPGTRRAALGYGSPGRNTAIETPSRSSCRGAVRPWRAVSRVRTRPGAGRGGPAAGRHRYAHGVAGLSSLLEWRSRLECSLNIAPAAGRCCGARVAPPASARRVATMCRYWLAQLRRLSRHSPCRPG